MRISERPSTLLGGTQQYYRSVIIERSNLVSDNTYYLPHYPHKYFSVRGKGKFIS